MEWFKNKIAGTSKTETGQTPTPESKTPSLPLLGTGNFNRKSFSIAPVDRPAWPGGNLVVDRICMPGDAVSIRGRQGDWIMIDTDIWVHKDYIDLNPTVPGKKKGETKPGVIGTGAFNERSTGIALVDRPIWPGGNILSDKVGQPGQPINIIARQGDWLMVDQDTWIHKDYVNENPRDQRDRSKAFIKTVSSSWKDYSDWLRNIDKMPPQIPPETNRDVSREQERIKGYLDSLPENEKARIAHYIKDLPGMDNSCRVAVMIPAFHEERGIFHTLEEWGNQLDKNGTRIDPQVYELNIVINREEGIEADKTQDEILRFKRTHPHLTVNMIDIVFPKGQGGVGPSRKLLTDIILQRSVNRNNNQKEALYIETEDADLLSIDRKAVYNLITKFDQNPQLDALRGKQDLAPDILKEHDYLFFERRAERFTEYLLRDYRLRPSRNPEADSRWNTIILGGWNSAFTAEAYALIGGYQLVTIGEDVDIGSRISLLRGTLLPSGEVLPNTDVIDTVRNVGQSNPRRFVYSLVTGKHAYHTFGEQEIDEAIRSHDPRSILEKAKYGHRIDDSNKEAFEKTLTDTLKGIRDAVKDPAMQRLLFSRLTLMLGFGKYKYDPIIKQRISSSLSEKEDDGWRLDYHIEPDGKVIIDNIGNIAAVLENYRQKGKEAEARSLPQKLSAERIAKERAEDNAARANEMFQGLSHSFGDLDTRAKQFNIELEAKKREVTQLQSALLHLEDQLGNARAEGRVYKQNQDHYRQQAQERGETASSLQATLNAKDRDLQARQREISDLRATIDRLERQRSNPPHSSQSGPSTSSSEDPMARFLGIHGLNESQLSAFPDDERSEVIKKLRRTAGQIYHPDQGRFPNEQLLKKVFAFLDRYDPVMQPVKDELKRQRDEARRQQQSR